MTGDLYFAVVKYIGARVTLLRVESPLLLYQQEQSSKGSNHSEAPGTCDGCNRTAQGFTVKRKSMASA